MSSKKKIINIDSDKIMAMTGPQDILYEEISALLQDTDTASEIKAAVSPTPERYFSAAAYSGADGNYSEEKTARGASDIENIISELNKPIQIVLDGKVIGESVMKFNRQYKRSTRT